MDSSLVSVLVNLGTGGVVVVLMILGFLVPRPTHTRVLEESAKKDEEIAKLQEALALERQRSNDATQAAEVTNQLIGGLMKLASGHHDEGHPPDGTTARSWGRRHRLASPARTRAFEVAMEEAGSASTVRP